MKSAYKVAVDSIERDSRHGQPSSSRSDGEAIDFEWEKTMGATSPK